MRRTSNLLSLSIPLLLMVAACDAAPGAAQPEYGANVTAVTNATAEAPTAADAMGSGRPQAPFPLPTGEPLESWQGIPVMPDAHAGGDRQGGGYAFLIRALEAEVIVFYDQAMSNLLWSTYARGTTKDGRFTTMLFYLKGAQTATVWIYQAGADAETLCLLLTLD